MGSMRIAPWADNIRAIDLMWILHIVPTRIAFFEQVWEVQLWKANPKNPEERLLVSSSRVSLLSNMPVPEHARDVDKVIKKYAKL